MRINHEKSRKTEILGTVSGVVNQVSRIYFVKLRFVRSKLQEENKVQKEDTDIFISFVTEYDSRIIDVPNYVNEAILKLGSKLVLSYTIV